MTCFLSDQSITDLLYSPRAVKIGGEQCIAVIIDFAMLPAQNLMAGNGRIVFLIFALRAIPAESGVWRRKLKINYKYTLTSKIILKRDPVMLAITSLTVFALKWSPSGLTTCKVELN